jgi:hypothetical protein
MIAEIIPMAIHIIFLADYMSGERLGF